jgi:hypothetical protein
VLRIHVAISAFELGKGYSYIQQGKVPLQTSPVDKSADFAGDTTLSKPGLLLHDLTVETLFVKITRCLKMPESIKIATALNVHLSNSQGVSSVTTTQHAVVSRH